LLKLACRAVASAKADAPDRKSPCLVGMLRTETTSFPSSGKRSHAIGMKNSKRYTIPPVMMISGVQLGPAAQTPKLFGEWQQRGPETLSGYVARKLRLTLAPPQSVVAANARG
jgi:hypothetical protein